MLVDTGFVSLSDLWPVVEAEPYKHLFVTISGSHQYGFSSHDSDIDLRGAHVLPVQEIAGLHKGPTTIEHTTEGIIPIDIVTHDVAKFCNLLLSKNGNVLENLYSPLVVTTTLAHEEVSDPMAKARGLSLNSTATQHIFADVLLWLHRSRHQGILTTYPYSSSLAE